MTLRTLRRGEKTKPGGSIDSENGGTGEAHAQCHQQSHCDIALHAMHMSIFVDLGLALPFWLKNGQKTAELMLLPAPGFAINSQECSPGPDGSIDTTFSEARDRAPTKRHHNMQFRLQNSPCAGP